MNILPSHAQVGARAAPEDFRQNIVRTGKVREARVSRVGMRRAALGEVAIISMLRSFGARRIDFAAVEARTLVRIAQKVVGHRNVLEFLFGFLVARIEVRMQLLRQAAIGLLDFHLGNVPLDSQSLVWIGGQRILLLHAPLRELSAAEFSYYDESNKIDDGLGAQIVNRVDFFVRKPSATGGSVWTPSCSTMYRAARRKSIGLK